jgi:O-antigen ligase
MVLAVFLYFKIPVMDYLVRKDGDGCRKLLALVHVEMVKTHPLLGIGYRDNMRQIADYWPEHLRSPNCEWARVEGSQAHNQILNVTGTTGLLGLFSYLGIVIWFFILNIRWYRQDRSDLALVCLIAQIYFQMSCLTEISFEFAKIRVLVLMVWALVVVRAPFTSRTKAS